MSEHIVAFDGDDTLWFHQHVFLAAQEKISVVMRPYVTEETWSKTFARIEIDNLRYYGYGIKSFILSVIDSAVQLAGAQISGNEIRQLMNISKDMLRQEVNVLQGTESVLKTVRKNNRVVLITKGDPVEQNYKLEASGLVEHFDVVEIVREKKGDTYKAIISKLGGSPDRFVMVGNTIKSDVLPVLEIGAWAIHIPQELIWAHEEAPPPTGHPRFTQAANIEAVPEVIRAWRAKTP